MLWTALCLPSATQSPTPHTEPTTPPSPLYALAHWALQFTPKVALTESAIVMELSGSVRLFGGHAALYERLHEEAREMGVQCMGWSSNSQAALAQARAGRLMQGRMEDWVRRPLDEQLDTLPVATLGAVVMPHRSTLARLGCRTLGQVRALPRSGLLRRFGREFQRTLDQAYGLQAETHPWYRSPDTFKAELDLTARVESAPALLLGARRLLLSLCGWLASRQQGLTACRFTWVPETRSSRHPTEPGELILRTSTPTRHIEHLSRLMAEHLAHIKLCAPVDTLALEALEVQPLPEASGDLLPQKSSRDEPLSMVMERLAARLGPQRVLRPTLQADHRLEWMTQWHPAHQCRPTGQASPATSPDLPQPCFILPEPLKLALQDGRPVYQGPLQLLTGPHRVECGWWASQPPQASQPSRSVAPPSPDEPSPDKPASNAVNRDYWLARSDTAGVLWVFQERQNPRSAWYLHGVFA